MVYSSLKDGLSDKKSIAVFIIFVLIYLFGVPATTFECDQYTCYINREYGLFGLRSTIEKFHRSDIQSYTIEKRKEWRFKRSNDEYYYVKLTLNSGKTIKIPRYFIFDRLFTLEQKAQKDAYNYAEEIMNGGTIRKSIRRFRW